MGIKIMDSNQRSPTLKHWLSRLLVGPMMAWKWILQHLRRKECNFQNLCPLFLELSSKAVLIGFDRLRPSSELICMLPVLLILCPVCGQFVQNSLHLFQPLKPSQVLVKALEFWSHLGWGLWSLQIEFVVPFVRSKLFLD